LRHQEAVAQQAQNQSFLQESLRADGWQLVRQRDNQVTAEHPLVKDEATARIRLQDLGLLTSAALYIEFIRSKNADPITQTAAGAANSSVSVQRPFGPSLSSH
jgi:hypothetical protein